jgi:tRNA-modifying protein YgfZ
MPERWHTGEMSNEQPWLDEPRDLVVVEGADALTYLQSQVSQDLRPLADGDSAWTFVLSPTGKVEVLARIVRNSPTWFTLDTDRGFGDALVARLNRFKIRVDATISLSAAGPAGERSVESEVARLRAGWPQMGAEIIPGETIPAETGVVDAAVSFTKGCYPGQELVERMDSRGAAAPRSLRSVIVPEGTRPGDDYIVDGQTAGRVTSVVGEVALALVRRQFLDVNHD